MEQPPGYTPPPPPPGGAPPPHDPQGTSSGLGPNVAGALAYLLGPITGVLFLVLEKENRFVRFHAAQSIGISVAWIVFWIAITILTTALAVVPVVGWIISILVAFLSIILGLVGLLLWLFLMFQAFSGNEWEFPWVGAQSRKMILGG